MRIVLLLANSEETKRVNWLFWELCFGTSVITVHYLLIPVGRINSFIEFFFPSSLYIRVLLSRWKSEGIGAPLGHFCNAPEKVLDYPYQLNMKIVWNCTHQFNWLIHEVRLEVWVFKCSALFKKNHNSCGYWLPASERVSHVDNSQVKTTFLGPL